jgi:glycosyltransferase involved in cell wall biosynthesis
LLVEHGCGWWVNPDPESLAGALRDATELADAERRQMGLRGRRLVEDRFSWPKIAAETTAVYQWLVRGGNPPACVLPAGASVPCPLSRQKIPSPA